MQATKSQIPVSNKQRLKVIIAGATNYGLAVLVGLAFKAKPNTVGQYLICALIKCRFSYPSYLLNFKLILLLAELLS